MAETQVHERAAVRDTGGGHPPAGSGSGSDSLFKNAYFLMLSTGVSAVLGLGFWLVAARYYSEDAVGQGSAAIAAMRLLASITATTMIGAVVRFVPRAGRETARLVWGVYGASSLVVALAAGVFLLTLDQWGASYAPLGTPLAGALFVAACVAWALLTLQDGVLTGLRKAEWVPAGNAVFSVGKLVLLVVFAGAMPVLGIFVSWAVAIAFSTIPLGWLIFRRLIPRQAAADRDREPPRLRDMGRFLAGDSLGALFSLAMINLLPVMVAVRFSSAENGYFYVAYTVGGTMEFMAINMASSLTAHASHDPRQLADGVHGALRRMTLLLVPVVGALVLFAPQILTPFSPDYAEHGSTVLRLLALGALPRVVVELYIGVLRVQGRTGVLAGLQGAMCVLVLGSAAVLFTPAGIAGAGWAVLISMTLVAVVSVFGLRSALRARPGELPVAAGASSTGDGTYGTRWAKLNATAGYGTGWARRAAYEEDTEDTVTLIIGHPGYEREALHSDTVAFIVRPSASAGRGTDDDAPALGGQEKSKPGAASSAADGGADGADGTGERPELADDVPRDEAGEAAGASAEPDADQQDGRAAPEEPGKNDEPVENEEPDEDDEPRPPRGAEQPAEDARPGARDETLALRDARPALRAGVQEPEHPRSPWDVVLPSAPAAGSPAGAPPDDPSVAPVPERRGNTEAGSPPWAGRQGPVGPQPGTPLPPLVGAPTHRPGSAHPAAPVPPPAEDPDRPLKGLLWALIGLATLVFWWSVRDLPWLRGGGDAELAGRELLEGMPLPALSAGAVLLLVFVASVTLCTRADALLTGAALGSALLALHAAPAALGREPAPLDGALYERTAGSLAEALGLDGPGTLLRWAPLLCTLLCLVPLWLLLAGAGGRLSWPGRWGVLYLIAVGGWVWRDELAPHTPLLLAFLTVLVLLLPLGRAAGRAVAGALPDRRRPNERSRD
ncbi:hypothetical protein GCM10009601_24530 [Streptomyces thermospinosisporus]|uniref:Lipopolysaccharide biosynthesis protein n=1 Tax=Streptomyces thermospinosisporus TaxID=161482 RepID=A0ABN1YU22_9ACTN